MDMIKGVILYPHTVVGTRSPRGAPNSPDSDAYGIDPTVLFPSRGKNVVLTNRDNLFSLLNNHTIYILKANLVELNAAQTSVAHS